MIVRGTRSSGVASSRWVDRAGSWLPRRRYVPLVSPDAPAAAPPKHLVLVLAMLSALVVLTTDVYLPVLPQLGADLGTNDAAAAASLSAALLGVALAQIVVGPISDATGRRRPLLLGLAAYAVTHLLCAVAPSIGALLVLRFFTGIATAAVMVVARAVVADVYPGREAAKAFATLGAVFGIVPVIAPVLGGLLAHVMSWRGMFVVLAAIGAVLVPVTARMVPESLPRDERIPPHVGAVVKDLAEVLTHRRFLAYAVVMATVGAMLFGYIGASSFVLQEHFGLSPQGYSYVFAINSMGFFAVSWVARSLVGRTGSHRLLLIGQVAGVVAAGVAAVGLATGTQSPQVRRTRSRPTRPCGPSTSARARSRAPRCANGPTTRSRPRCSSCATCPPAMARRWRSTASA